MELKLIEFTQKDEICQAYGIYKHCMFMPTEEKFSRKTDQFLSDHSVRIFACFCQGSIVGMIVVTFVDQKKIEITGIAVDAAVRSKGIGSYMINQVVNDFGLISVYAQTDRDAVGFYRKNGFRVAAVSQTYDGETVVRYQCEWSR
ncbi:MAG: GNAT family N-acetyltransferase [Clostridia bacterium]|nr:GNAT family N-acetyltransferase [Clostridia bacterium]